jgi:hypothetical protein
LSGTHVPAAPGDVVERYVVRIEAHLLRLAEGPDPMGRLLGIERLARATRAERREEQHQSKPRLYRP